MRIDSHQHFWRLARGDYGWLTRSEHPEIYRDFLPTDLLPLLKDARVDKTILVQAAPTLAETEFLLGVADSAPFVGGVVGWVDFEAPDAAATIARIADHPKLLGLRPMLHDLADDAWLLGRNIEPAVDAMTQARLTFDALIKPRHLPVLEEFVRRHPDLPVVIDHGAKPDIRSSALEPWADGIRKFAPARNVSCKLSGLATEAGPGWSAESLKPYVDILLDTFGAERLMWGSDWPVLNEASNYETWLRTAETLTRRLGAREREFIFGDTAATFYGIAK